jgi:hypothetical protein
MNQGIAVVVGDGVSGSALVNNGGEYGSINTRNFGSFRCFGYNTTLAEHRASLMDFLNNIKEGDYIFIFTVVKNSTANLGTEDWENDRASYGTTLFEVLENNGAKLMDQLKEYKNVPYVFMYRKGFHVLSEKISESIFGEVNAEGFVPRLGTEGEMKSVRIGPATAWSRVDWEATFDQEEDLFSLEVVGVKENGEQETLLQNQTVGTIDLSNIDARIYPEIRLIFKSKDDKSRTSPNPAFLRVFFDPLPEFIFSNKGEMRFARDTLLQGENMEFEYTIENIGSAAPDSVQIHYSLVDNQNSENIFTKKIKALDNEERVPVSFTFNTSEALGKYQFSTQINPEPSQDEQFYFNNVGIRNFEVIKDQANPILDVTFDGIRIMDDDIVAARPEITITLQDENPYFLIDEPTFFDIQLDTGNIVSLVTISPDDPALEFTPATTDNLEAKLIYRPTLKDGTYTLHVQGKDASENISGDNKYSVSFKVVDRKMVSNVFNYPNPFSTRTQFVFTLTGQVPNDLKIQIMTVSGKVVREIRKDELGDLRIGINRTDYWWDGTDEYGDKLANGVYLYRLVMPKSLEYENFDLGNSGNNVDSYFKEGFGKMVIMR